MIPKHGRVITTTSYYEGEVASTKSEVEVSQFTTRESMLRDVIDSLSVINKGETTKLTLEICVDAKSRYKIVRKWSV